MLTYPTLDKLKAMRFTGMARALEEQMQMAEIDSLSFEERLGLLIDRALPHASEKQSSDKTPPLKILTTGTPGDWIGP